MSLTIRGTLEEQIYATVGFTASSASGRPSPARQEDELFLGLSMVIHANNTGNYYANRSLPGNPSEVGDEVDGERVVAGVGQRRERGGGGAEGHLRRGPRVGRERAV